MFAWRDLLCGAWRDSFELNGAIGKTHRMSRYKGRATLKTIERDYPHVVEILVPEGSLGATQCTNGIVREIFR